LFGAIFDSACIYWQYDCDRRGNCWIYDNVHLSQRAVIMGMLGIGLNLIFSFLTWLVYPTKTASEKKSLQPLTMSQVSRDSYDVSKSNSLNSPVKMDQVVENMNSNNDSWSFISMYTLPFNCRNNFFILVNNIFCTSINLKLPFACQDLYYIVCYTWHINIEMLTTMAVRTYICTYILNIIKINLIAPVR